MQNLPQNYNFEMHKVIRRINAQRCRRVCLQVPDGLYMYTPAISDMIMHFCKTEVVILTEPTYGACCVDDYTAADLGCDFLIHYGHSCLYPVTSMLIGTMYVFVDIIIDTKPLIETIEHNFASKNILLAGTVQFLRAMFSVLSHFRSKQQRCKTCSAETQSLPHGTQDCKHISIYTAQERPLSPGEVLGCTAPKIKHNVDCVLFVADGRFHMEAMMIANPEHVFYQYSPASGKTTRESYNNKDMIEQRRTTLKTIKETCRTFGILRSMLGRQGNGGLVERIETLLERHGAKKITILIEEMNNEEIEKYDELDAFIQIGCPRMSIDWGHSFSKPIITPYEAYVLFGETHLDSTNYPTDYYSKENAKEWSNYY